MKTKLKILFGGLALAGVGLVGAKTQTNWFANNQVSTHNITGNVNGVSNTLTGTNTQINNNYFAPAVLPAPPRSSTDLVPKRQATNLPPVESNLTPPVGTGSIPHTEPTTPPSPTISLVPPAQPSSAHRLINDEVSGDVAVVVVDAHGAIDGGLTDRLIASGKTVRNRWTGGLFAPAFGSSPAFNRLFDGEAAVIDELGIKARYKYLVIAKYQVHTQDVATAVVSYTARATLDVRVFSGKTGERLRSWTATGDSTDLTPALASSGAITELNTKLSNASLVSSSLLPEGD